MYHSSCAYWLISYKMWSGGGGVGVDGCVGGGRGGGGGEAVDFRGRRLVVVM